MSDPQPIASAYFREPKPTAIRLWHWLSFLFLLGSLTTVLFGSTLFRTRNNVTMVQEQVERKGGTVTVDQARNVAHEYSDKLWMLHKYIGYGLATLLLCRIVTEVTLSKEQTIGSRIRSALSHHSGPEKKHYLLVQYGYLIFYGLFILMATTGLILAFEDQKWLDPLHKPAKTLHETIQWGIYAYILFHLAGVIRADINKYGGIVSRMINGRK